MKKSVWHKLLVYFPFLLLFAVLPLTCSAASGTCGDNLTWSYEGTTLTISGQGEMGINDHVPWGDCRETCTKVIIEEGVTSIGHGAFAHFTNLHQIVIPDTVTKIADYAFSRCGLKELPLTEHINEVGSFAFEGCDIYEAMILPGIKVVSYGMFSGCKIRNLTISQGITEIQSYAFSGCNFLTTVVIPDSVTTVGSSAFSGCTGLKNITLGKSITAITNSMFSGCSSLESIVIPDSVEKINNYAFKDCKKLSSVTIGAGVKEVSTSAFQKTPALNRVTLSDANPYLHKDNGVLYREDLSMLVLALPNFSGEYTVLPGTKKIGQYAFFECDGLEQITLPDSVTAIGQYSFYGCKNLTQINFGGCLETIEQVAFSGCSGLEELRFPPTVQKIEVGAFDDCSGLKTVYFTGGFPSMTAPIFTKVKAIVYYPAYHPTWNQEDSVEKIREYIVAVMYDNVIVLRSLKCSGEHKYGDWTEDAAGNSVRLCTICGTQDKKVAQTEDIPPETTAGDTPPETTAGDTPPETTAGDTPPETTVGDIPPETTAGTQDPQPTTNGDVESTGTTAQTQEPQTEGNMQTESAATEATVASHPKENIQTEATEMGTTGESPLPAQTYSLEEAQEKGNAKWIVVVIVSVVVVASGTAGGLYLYKIRKKI